MLQIIHIIYKLAKTKIHADHNLRLGHGGNVEPNKKIKASNLNNYEISRGCTLYRRC